MDFKTSGFMDDEVNSLEEYEFENDHGPDDDKEESDEEVQQIQLFN